MSRGNRRNPKGRQGSSTFFRFPHEILLCPNYISLSHIGKSLLNEFALQFKGSNNGDLVATWKHLSQRGWASKSTIAKHVNELAYYGFIVLIQDGGINVGGKKRPNLYALSWLTIDKVGYSDGFHADSPWKVGDLPKGWQVVKPPYYEPQAKRKSPTQLRDNKKLKSTSCTRPDPPRVLKIVGKGEN